MNEKSECGEIVERIFRLLPETKEFHSPTNELFKVFNDIIHSYFVCQKQEHISIDPFKGIIWPHLSLGNFYSYETFGMTGMIHYAFYYKNRKNYKIVFDIGANTGIDSIILDKFGYEVHSFEPDPNNYSLLLKNIKVNSCKQIHTYPKAISNYTGSAEFIRVLGNITANHIVGSRDFYGDVERINVDTMTLTDVGVSPDLMKINVEGHEKDIIPTISKAQWEKCDAFIGIHNKENQEVLYHYFKDMGVNIFCQKKGWRKAECIDDVPSQGKEGYVFVSKKDEMPF